MYRVFLYFCGCEPEWIDLGTYELSDTSTISEFLVLLNAYHFIPDDEANDPNSDMYREICEFIIDLCNYSSLHSIFRYHDDRIEVFHV